MVVELWFRAFVVTFVVEAVLVEAIIRERSRAVRITAALIANLVTHPLIWFVIPAFGLSEPLRRAVSELWAIVAEAIFYRIVFPGTTARKVAAASLICNGASLGVGLLLRALGIDI